MRKPVAGIEPAVTLPILRHIPPSHLRRPVDVAAQLGHADTRMTEKHMDVSVFVRKGQQN